jgi:acetyl-CoA C-acetyltransferase
MADTLPVHARPDPLSLAAVAHSAQKAFSQAAMTPADVSFFEVHDAYTIMACLSLEAAGFAPPGSGCQMAAAGAFALDGKVPIATFGGLKARGHPVGATGVYQAAEAFLQLTGQAGANQVAKAQVGALLLFYFAIDFSFLFFSP